MCNKPKICLVDDDLATLESMTGLIRAEGYAVVLCRSREALFHSFNEENLFCIVAEMNLLEPSELVLLPIQLRSLPIIFMATIAAPTKIVDLMKAGAIDFLCKPISSDRFIAAIHEAMRKHQKSLQAASEIQKFCRLTQREKEVLGCVVSGMLNKQIAAQLGISEKTIKVHRSRVMRKMEARSIAELVRCSDRFAQAANLHEPSRIPT